MSLARVATRLSRLPTHSHPRTVSRSFTTGARSLNARRLATYGIASTVVTGGAFYAYRDASVGHAEQPLEVPISPANPSAPLSELVRTYIVYSLCSLPLLVDWSPSLLSTLMAIPGVKQITEAVVRVTFFDQFVGGDEAEDVVPVLERLRAENKGALFVYSVEVDDAHASGSSKSSETLLAHKQIVQETVHCIDVAADFEDRHSHDHTGKGTWVAIKLSAMAAFQVPGRHTAPDQPRVAFPGCPLPSDLDVLMSGASNVTITAEDITALRELREDLNAICERARARGVRITVDAEHRLPAIDALTSDMMRKFNKLPKPSRYSWFRSHRPAEAPSGALQPLIYNTFQAYLRRTPEYLAQSISAARAEGYALGVKLVRGAYHPHEIDTHRAASASRASASQSSPSGNHDLSISPDNMPPVWLAKDETDTCYDASVRLLISLIREDVEACERTGSPPAIGALFGTHNWSSADLVVDELVKQGLARCEGDRDHKVVIGEGAMQRVAVAQLYGMSDGLTDHLVARARSSSPFVLKYVPYGHLSEVMPYLSRRAIENKSVLGNGGAALERKRAASAIISRFFG
ncbi:FAD-linked oxidoreductase-like protein [Daedaleopsis nitida]|nr:FAD-linked oxidoreductase-like protein [Daedaleopsis nitida]